MTQKSGKAESFLKHAAAYFELANKADPSYLPAKINLAVSYLYLGRPHQARAVLREKHPLAVNNAAIQGLKALSLYEQSDADVDLWPAALGKLEQLAAENGASPMQTYNIARLLTVRPRMLQARIFWNRLAAIVSELPASIQGTVCLGQIAMKPGECKKPAQTMPVRKKWQLPLPKKQLEHLAPSLH